MKTIVLLTSDFSSIPSREKSRSLENIPVASWFFMVLMALGGSLIYGFSISEAASLSMAGRSGFLVAVPAGLGWCCLGLVLLRATRKNPLLLAEICLVSMFWGEVWLVLGAFLNWSWLAASGRSAENILMLNAGWIVLSNLLMFYIWFSQLSKIGMKFYKAFFLWLVFLNGTGVAAFWILRKEWGTL